MTGKEAGLHRTVQASISRGETHYVAECLEIGVITQGKTLDETVANLQEAVALFLWAGTEQGLKGEAEMSTRHILTEYVEQAMAQAVYDKIEDGTFTGRIPPCKGVIAFGPTLRECEDELRSTLEDWILVGLKMGHALPLIGGIDLNKGPVREPVDTV